MELKNIFKMELYKNSNDKQYLFVIAVLAIMAALVTFFGIAAIEGNFNQSFETALLFYPLLVFTFMGLGVFSLLYPFHLLNVDYKNKVMSLVFASGVGREKYYFVKVSATIITCLIATLVIMFIPSVTFLVVYRDEFTMAMRFFIEGFSVVDIAPFVLSSIFGLLLNIVILTTSVIITKGKVTGIFLYFLFLFVTSSISNAFVRPFKFAYYENISNMFYMSVVSSIICICIFTLIGLYVLRKQDL